MRPCVTTSPLRAGIRPSTVAATVVLPMPLGPTMATFSPARTLKVSPVTISGEPGQPTARSRTSRLGIGDGRARVGEVAGADGLGVQHLGDPLQGGAGPRPGLGGGDQRREGLVQGERA